MLTTEANIKKHRVEKFALPFFYPMSTHTWLWASLKIPHSLRSSGMLKPQNAPPDHVTVTRFGLRKHQCVIRTTVSLVHNEHKKRQIFLKEDVFGCYYEFIQLISCVSMSLIIMRIACDSPRGTTCDLIVYLTLHLTP